MLIKAQSPINFYSAKNSQKLYPFMGPADKNPEYQYNQQQFFPIRPIKKGKNRTGSTGKNKKNPLLHSFAKEEVMFCR
jgi:hypothetical protein